MPPWRISASVNLLFNCIDWQYFKTGPDSPSSVFSVSPFSVRPEGSQPIAETVDTLPEIEVPEKVASQLSWLQALSRVKASALHLTDLGISIRIRHLYNNSTGREIVVSSG